MDVFQVYKEILNEDLVFPEWYDCKEGMDVIKNLLNKFPHGRIGNSLSILKAFDYFKGVNWDRLINMEEKPPFIPDSRMNGENSEEDKSTEEEMCLRAHIHRNCEQ